MSRNPLAGHRGVWLRQLADTGERSFPGVLATMQQFGFDLLAAKVMDGGTWQGTIDPLTPIHGLPDIAGLQTLCQQHGVTFLPVVVPRGVHPYDEANAHAAVAETCGSVMVDLEPFAGLWDGSSFDQIPGYCAQLRTAAPDAYLIIEPDARPYAWNAVNLPALVPSFDGCAAQQYVGWTSGGVNWTDVATEVQRYQALAALGWEMGVTLWGLDTTALAVQFWQALLAGQPQPAGFVTFSFGAMNRAELTTFGALPVPRPVPPQPTDADVLVAGRALFAQPPDLATVKAFTDRFG